jgi:DNA-binding response OmpR family regulator
VNRVLLVTNDPADAGTLKDVLGQAGSFDIAWETQLSAALDRVRIGDIDAIIVELSLPDSTGIATFDQLFAAGRTPIMTLSAVADETLAVEAIVRGAEGHLLKGFFAETSSR